MEQDYQKDIFDHLLMAGYFRIRLPWLNSLDKILGGLSWCINCSNVQVDVRYSDEMNIKEKLVVSEKIVQALKEMKCPFTLFPHQIQGLDLKSLYPIFQWLLKFVHESRLLRQDKNQEVSQEFSKNIINKPQKQSQNQNYNNRHFINKNNDKFPLNHPIRIYSTLREFDDESALKQYNKLFSEFIVQNKNSYEQNNQQNTKQRNSSMDLSSFQTMDINNQQNINEQLIQNLQNTLEDKLQQSVQTILSQPVNQDSQNIFYNQQQIFIQQQDNIQQKINQLDEETEKLKNQQINQENVFLQIQLQPKYQVLINNLQQSIKLVEKEISQNRKNFSQSELSTLYNQIESKFEIENRKQDLKKQAKHQALNIKKMKEKMIQNIPTIDENQLVDLQNSLDEKQQKYDELFTHFASQNQEIQKIQRDLGSLTSQMEVAQYNQRFIEIFGEINKWMEAYSIRQFFNKAQSNLM